MTRLLRVVLPALVALAPLHAQEDRAYPGGSFNWAFRERHAEAARLFNAFDYGHAVLYERLLTLDSARAGAALDREYRFLVGDLLVDPPRLPVVEEALAPHYARLARPAIVAFDRAHVLHRQIYDVYARTALSAERQHAMVEALIDRYLAGGWAFVGVPKSMALMDDQPFSQRFRRERPVFNGLIWAYHWLQVGLYEPLVTERDPVRQRAAVDSVVAHFRWMVADPSRFPATMPMTAEVSPTFARLHPRAAAIFDNLHMMHDIISDVLAQPAWSEARKREEILRQLAMMRDGSRDLMEGGHVH